MNSTFDAIPPGAMAMQLLPPGQSLQIPHGQVNRKITPCHIIAQVLFGSYEVTLQGRREVIGPGQALMAPANELMTLTHHGDPAHRGFMGARWIYFHFTLFSTLGLTTLLDLPLRLEAPVAKPLGEIIVQLLQMSSPQPPMALQWLARRQELAYSILRILCSLGPLKPRSQAILLHSERLAAVFSYIHEHIAHPIDVAQLARATHMSLSRFHVFFRDQMGCTPMDYVKRVRLNEASKALVTSDASIAQISQQVGFCNPFHFSREFKSVLRMTPSDYRRSSSSWFSDARLEGPVAESS